MGYAEAQYIIDEVNNVTGIQPMPVSNANVNVLTKYGNTYIRFLASDSIIDGHVLCYVDKVIIVRKVDSAPTSINDGIVVVTMDREHIFDYAEEPYVIEGYTEEAYYAFFTISDHGIICSVPVVKFASKTICRFAYHQDFTELDPDKTITYLNWGDLFAGANPIHTNEDTGTVTYGDFENFFILKENKPYMVKSDWTADYALDPDDYTKKLDGSDSDVSNTSYEGLGAYAWMPRFYMKEIYASDGNSRDVYFSNEKEDSKFYPVGFVDYSVGEVEGLWIPMYYPGSDGKSLSGRTGYNVITKINTDKQKAIINLNGANARFLGGSIMNALRDLEYGLYKSTDIQKHGGYGNCSGFDSSVATYGMTTNPVLQNGIVSGFKGTGTSSDPDSRKQANKAFHSNVLFTYDMSLRDPYTLAAGNGSGQFVRIRAKYFYAISNASYADDSEANMSRVRTNGYSSRVQKYFGVLPQSLNYGNNLGSDVTGLCDYDIWGKSNNGTYIALRLGGCNDNLNAGPAALFMSTGQSSTNDTYGAAPLIIPPANYTPS